VNPPLYFKAGPAAMKIIEANGLTPESVDAIAGAAGGPKWLVLAAMDKLLFGEWLRPRSRPLPLVGSSIGSWRFAAVSQADPVAAIERLERLYIEQSYSLKPSYAEVTQTARSVVAELLGESGAQELLEHPWARIHIVTALCKGWTGQDASLPLLSGFALATAINGLNRNALGVFLERHVFADARSGRLASRAFPGFYTQLFDLNETNLADALLGSGSIPFVMEAVSIDGSEGNYRDGGMVDYHMDLPLSDTGLVLMPHFSKLIVPGWLDKFAPWRKPRFLDNTLVIHPSEEWIASLPNSKIPDRSDFQRYGEDYDGRVRDWRTVVARSTELAEFLAERLLKQDWRAFITAL
jgi:hypothetical protein